MDISQKAIMYIKKNQKKIIAEFIDESKYVSSDKPSSYFMAGSPGAGKTEYSRRFIEYVELETHETIVRIDGDEIRQLLPQYNGHNAYMFQEAISIGVNKFYDYVLKKSFSVLIDSTFASCYYAENNVRRSLDKGRIVNIVYIYQDPVKAWEFTRARALKEGREIPLNVFIRDYFKARENVNNIKKLFGASIKLTVIRKDYKNNIQFYKTDVDSIDEHIKDPYDSTSLIAKLRA